MKRRNATRKALLTSVLSLLLCVSMLVGTTFAWFTDSVESGRNIIAAGNLDVELYHSDKDETNVQVDGSTKLFNDVVLWEPGAVLYDTLQVKNVGTLALKYQLDLSVLDETVVDGYRLSDVIKVGVVNGTLGADTTRDGIIGAVNTWTELSKFSMNQNDVKLEVGGEDTFTVVLYWMPNSNEVDNRYNMNNGNQGKTLQLEMGVNLYATQVEAESDSFGADYDAPAYTTEVANLKALLAAAQPGDTVTYTLTHDAYVNSDITVPNGVKLSLNGNGHKIIAYTTGPVFKAVNADIEISDLTITGKAKFAIYTNGARWYEEDPTVDATLTNVTVDLDQSGDFPVAFNGIGNITLKDCVVTGAAYVSDDHGNGLHVFAGAEIKLTVDGGKIGGIMLNSNYAGRAEMTAQNGAEIDKVDIECSTATDGSLVAAPVTNDGATINETVYAVYKRDQLQAAITTAAAGNTILIVEDIADVAVTVDKSLTITGDKTLNNVSITASGTDVELTVSELTFTGNSWINANNAKKLTVSGVTANVAPSNGTATNSRSAFISLGSSERNTLELVVEDCNIVIPAGTSGVLGWAQITKATITGNTFGSETTYISRLGSSPADAVKVMSIANGAEFTVTGNTVYTNSNGFAFGQNTTRGNAYTVVADNNTFYGAGDHIWVEVSGATTTHATIQATSNNTVNGKTFTAADIKSTSRITTWTYYAGVDVVTDESGKLIGGTFVKLNNDCVATGYKAVALDGVYVVVDEKIDFVSTAVELENALKAGHYAVLTSDITMEGRLDYEQVGYNINIDGAGHTLTLGGIYGKNGANVTLSNMTLVDNNDDAFTIYNQGGKVELTNVTYTSNLNKAFWLAGGGELVLNNCNITGDVTGTYSASNIWCGDGRTVTVNGGTYGSIFMNVSEGANMLSASKITVNDGTIGKLILETEKNTDTGDGMGYKSAVLVQNGGTITELVENPQNIDLTGLTKLN